MPSRDADPSVQAANQLARCFRQHFGARFPSLLGSHILVALSGGADSVALLHLMRQPELGLELEAAHVHHGVRGREADDDAEFCGSLCDVLGVPFHLVTLSPPVSPREGREGAWRQLRYRHLLALAGECGAAAVATGHQRDDVAEGVVVQLLRGGGPRALAGIAEHTAEGVIRPLLPWPRQTIAAWLAVHGLSWRDDSSNLDAGHLRNAVRHQVLPELERFSPRVRDHLVYLAGALAEDEHLLAAELVNRACWIDPWHPQGGVPLALIRSLPPPLRSRWLHAQAERAGIGKVTRRQLQQLQLLLDHRQPPAITLAGRWRLRCAGAQLWLEPGSLPGPYWYRLDPGSSPPRLPIPWLIRISERDQGGTPDLWRWTLPASGRVTVHSPRSSDTIRGGDLRRLLAASLPRHLRASWPVFRVGDTIEWIPGVWQDASPAGERNGNGTAVVEVIRR